MTAKFQYPRGLRVGLKIKLDASPQGRKSPGASDRFLDAIGPIIYTEKSNIEKGAYITPGRRQDLLDECHERFRKLQNFVADLPEHVRREINGGVYQLGIKNLERIKELKVKQANCTYKETEELQRCIEYASARALSFDDLESLLSKLADASKHRSKSINKRAEGKFGISFRRLMFLGDIVREYKNAFGELPEHYTYNRKEDPKTAKRKGFHDIAYAICELVGYSPKGIEEQLAAIIGVKPPQNTAEVGAETRARGATQASDK